MKIKKGKKYKCVNWLGDNFTDGKTYKSHKDGFLMGEFCPVSFNGTILDRLFKKAPSLKKRVKALEKNVIRLNSAVAILLTDKATKEAFDTDSQDFKAIADHAKAITDIIKGN